MAVHQAGHDYASAGIDMPIRNQASVIQQARHFLTAANRFDQIITYNYGPIFNFTPLIIHGNQYRGIVN
jgi:hypothetical protein